MRLLQPHQPPSLKVRGGLDRRDLAGQESDPRPITGAPIQIADPTSPKSCNVLQRLHQAGADIRSGDAEGDSMAVRHLHRFLVGAVVESTGDRRQRHKRRQAK